MAAFTSGVDWSFDNVPGGYQHQEATHTQHEPTNIHESENPQHELPQHELPQHELPQNEHLQNELPQNEHPQHEHPQTEHSQTEHPQTEHSQTEHPQNEHPQHEQTPWPPRQCRICLEVVPPSYDMNESSLPATLRPKPRVTYSSEEGGRLLRPCKCKGTQQYVHEDCLTAWRLADPLRKRNYWECPTCRYRYHLQRLTWASHISMFVLGFIADPIINAYFEGPIHTIINAGGPTGSLVFEDEPAGWAEHFVKGLASLGLLGFAKFLFTLSPFNLINVRTGGFGNNGGRGGIGGNGRDRLSQMGWLAIMVGVITFLFAVWKGVRAWSRRTLQAAGERVMDVPGSTDEHEDKK